MNVVLSHGKNPDILCGGYWSAIKRPKPTVVKVKSFAEASQVCRAYITRYELGGGNWTGGDIWNGKKYVGYVSFNGRVWKSREWPSEEISL